MKVAYIVSFFPRLSETFVLNQITGLLDRGHHVDIYALQKTDEEKVHADVGKYRLLDRLCYIRVPPNKLTRILVGIKLIINCFHNGPKVVFRSLNVFKYGRRALSLDILHNTLPLAKNYDIIHCHFGPSGRFAVLIKELGIRAKLVTTFHGYDIRVGLRTGGRIYRRLFEIGDCIIAISPYNYEILIDFGCDPTKIIYHPVGIDLDRFSFRGQLQPPGRGQHIRLITVARLVEEKGIEYAIRAVHKLLHVCPEVSLQYDITGTGPLEEELNQLIKALHLTNHVHLIGPKNQDEVIEALHQSHIFLLPSIAEALPLVLMEAQATGLPVVATAVGSTDQIVLDGESGFLVQPKNADVLAEKLKYLIENPGKWSEMGMRGRKHVEENFDINKLNDRLVGIFQQLLVGDLGKTRPDLI
jgi:colanic acid/amylovoran biosynthesis glycosyltransferase